MKSTTALLALVSSTWLLASCGTTRPDPPSAVEVKVAVPVPCRIPEPQCATPAYDAARRDQDGDLRLRLLRAETAAYADCVRLYRLALSACREASP